MYEKVTLPGVGIVKLIFVLCTSLHPFDVMFFEDASAASGIGWA
jgi:hypothetical protein